MDESVWTTIVVRSSEKAAIPPDVLVAHGAVAGFVPVELTVAMMPCMPTPTPCGTSLLAGVVVFVGGRVGKGADVVSAESPAFAADALDATSLNTAAGLLKRLMVLDSAARARRESRRRSNASGNRRRMVQLSSPSKQCEQEVLGIT